MESTEYIFNLCCEQWVNLAH